MMLTMTTTLVVADVTITMITGVPAVCWLDTC